MKCPKCKQDVTRRITITGVIDLDDSLVTERDIQGALDEIRGYGTAEVTNVEPIFKGTALPVLRVADDWGGD